MLLMLLLLLLLTLPAVVQAQFTYTTNNGTITITGYTGSGGAVTVPSTTNGYPVTCIGYNAFYECTKLTSIAIPDSVTTIGHSAFGYCSSLTSVTIPDSVTDITDDAFQDCARLTAILVDVQNSFYSSVNGVLFTKDQTTLVVYAPGKTGSYAIPDGVTQIGYRAFAGCSGLTRLIISRTVNDIATEAFIYCPNFEAIEVNELNPVVTVQVLR